jgi:hypothetical protein
MATWRGLITEEMTEQNDAWVNVAGHTMSEKDLDRRFSDGFGGSNGCAFTLWTHSRVYFPVVYDGAEWVGSVARHPCDEASKHHGGEGGGRVSQHVTQ